eukprot:353336-Chlamydomonas_euryale.AAC.13
MGLGLGLAAGHRQRGLRADGTTHSTSVRPRLQMSESNEHPKVGDLDLAVRVEQQVGRLDVAVHDVQVLMQVEQAAQALRA